MYSNNDLALAWHGPSPTCHNTLITQPTCLLCGAANLTTCMQAQVDSLKAELERQRKSAADAYAARVESDKALAAAQAKLSASQMSMQAKVDELEQSK